MHYALYISSAVRPFSDEELEDLLEVSRRNNSSAGVSGMLLYHDGNFIQYIEGDKSELDRLLSRINDDRRHRGVIVLETGEREARAFGDWSMGFEHISRDELAQHGAFDLSRDALERSLDPALPKSVIVMMRTFYDSGHRHTRD